MTSSVQSPIIDEEKSGKSSNPQNQNTSADNNASRRHSWNMTVNGGTEATEIAGGVADLWPSLSEGVKLPVKKANKAVAECVQSPLSVTSQASSSKTSAGNSGSKTNPSNNGTRSGSNRQPKGNSSRSSSGNGERFQQQQHQPSSQGPVSQGSSNNGSHNANSQLGAGQNNGPRPPAQVGQYRDSDRRGNGGGPPRGDGSHGRRPPTFNVRNGTLPPPVFPGPFPAAIPRPVLPVAPYPPPPPPFPPMPFMAPGIHPSFGRPMLYGPPIRPRPPFVPMGPQIVIDDLCRQIEYYFSEDNLVKDVHLRTNMDEQGWVLVNIIAEFRKVKEIIAKVKTFLDDKEIDHLSFILNALRNSRFVEVQGNKLRKRNLWEKYVLRNIGESSSTATESPVNAELAVRLDKTTIAEEPVTSDFRTEAGDKAKDDQVGQQPL